MAADISWQQATSLYAEANTIYEQGNLEKAAEMLRHVVLLFAVCAGQTRQAAGDTGPNRTRADACRLLADCLAQIGRYAESVNVYQEATDLYAQFGTEEGEQLSRSCARKLLENIAALKAQPQERLHLLVAHYERIQQQLALEPDTEFQQAECCIHIARIFQRRERPEDSIARYREAIALLDRMLPTTESELARAECHHRIATQLVLKLNDLPDAERHYRQAIALYAAHEPVAYGFQSSLELCRAALGRIEPLLHREENPLNME